MNPALISTEYIRPESEQIWSQDKTEHMNMNWELNEGCKIEGECINHTYSDLDFCFSIAEKWYSIMSVYLNVCISVKNVQLSLSANLLQGWRSLHFRKCRLRTFHEFTPRDALMLPLASWGISWLCRLYVYQQCEMMTQSSSLFCSIVHCEIDIIMRIVSARSPVSATKMDS